MNPLARALVGEIGKVIVGKEETIRHFLVGFLAGGHLLLLDVPGIGKTLLARSFARVTDLTFSRVQGTPDLTPGDILGVNLFDGREGCFQFHRGPIFANILLFDEINRTSPKTQSALLEAMAEGAITLDGEAHPLPTPFFLIATANPLESSGTFELPDSQLDRFLMRIPMGYPTAAEELKLYRGEAGLDFLDLLTALAGPANLKEAMAAVKKTHIADKLLEYVHQIVTLSRQDETLAMGISPRGAQAWIGAAKARAFIEGREFVLPDDLIELAHPVLDHRLFFQIGLDTSFERQRMTLTRYLEKVAIPI